MITLTDKVMQYVSRCLIRRDGGVGLRVGMKTTDCSSLAYKLEYADETATEDQVFESSDAKVIAGPKSLPYIDGTELDYTCGGLDEEFRSDNPDVKDECGYGGSFRV